MIQLLTHEKQALAFFILQSKEQQALILLAARKDTKVSGCLIDAYRLINSNIV